MPARFYEQEVKAGLKNKRRLSAFLDNLVAAHMPDRKKADLTYIFCDDTYLLQMNRQYLEHDTFTDIITFDLSEHNTLIGELYISIERVKDNAAKYHTTQNDELHRVIFHGALHLCGFKDKKEADKAVMRQKENECLDAYTKELSK
ncbi:MAG: rRNA maturation RNase YbeY [Taibaiella sp.]|nr:rRNA maturation RNase YbeY [Taibaiella sp.]